MSIPARDIPLGSHVVTFHADTGAPRVGVLVRKTACFVHLVGSFYYPSRGWSGDSGVYSRRFDGVIGFVPPGISTDASRHKLKLALGEAFEVTPRDMYGFCTSRRNALIAVLERHNFMLVEQPAL